MQKIVLVDVEQHLEVCQDYKIKRAVIGTPYIPKIDSSTIDRMFAVLWLL